MVPFGVGAEGVALPAALAVAAVATNPALSTAEGMPSSDLKWLAAKAGLSPFSHAHAPLRGEPIIVEARSTVDLSPRRPRSLLPRGFACAVRLPERAD